MNIRLLITILLFSFSIGAKAQYTQIFHTSGAQQYNCNTVTVGPAWWFWYYNQTQFTNLGTNYTCGVGPYSDSTWNNNQYYWWGGYQFNFATPVSAVRFQIVDMELYDWVEIFVNGQYYPLQTTNVSPFPGTCNQIQCGNFGYLYMTTTGSGGCQVDISGTIDSVAILTSANYNYYNNQPHDITYSAYFLDPNYINLTASSNNPGCGQSLTFTTSNVVGALSWSWTGPNNFTSNQQNPTINNVGYLQSGTYYVTVTTACGTTTVAVVVNIITPNAPSVANSVIDYCVGQTPAQLAATGTNLLWYTQPVGGTGSSTAPTPSTAVPGTFVWYVSQTVAGCESPRDSITVNVYAVPAAPSVSSNSPVCSGNQIQLYATSTGASFAWTGPNTFTSTSSSPIISNAQSIHAGTYSVTATVNGCTSVPSTVSVVVNPTPVVNAYSHVNPTTCNGTNGSITLGGLTPNTSYTITYNKDNIAQTPLTQTANGSGQLIIGGLSAGIYSSISITINGCSSAAIPTFTLVDPNPPMINVSATNSTNCTTPNGSLIITGLTAGTYTVNYSYNGTPQTPVVMTITGSQLVVSNLPSGSYTNITVTSSTTNCTSNIAVATINGPAVPTIYSIVTNPTSCNVANGSILLTGLVSGTSYMINYTQNGTPYTITQTAVNGTLSLSNLPIGTYTNIFVVINGCATNVLGPLNLVGPNAPATPTLSYNGPVCEGQSIVFSMTPIPQGNPTYIWTGPNNFTSGLQAPTITNAQVNMSGTYTLIVSVNGCTSVPATINVVVNPNPAAPTAGSNTPVCSGNTLNLTATSTTVGADYVWSGPNTFGSLLQNPSIPNVTTAASGPYTVTATENGCNSAPVTINVAVTQTPAITALPQNPSSCGGTNGSITLLGVVNNNTYTVNFDKNGIAQTPQTLIASGGTVIITGLGVGTYTNITASLNGCPSNVVGPITLVGPIVPATPTAASNSPLCEGDTLQLTASTVTGATYSWTGPNFTANTQNGSVNNVTLAAAGTYSVIATVSGCNSLPGTVNVVVNPQPAIPSLSNNGPVCEGNALNLMSNTIPGVTYTWSGPGTYSSTLQNPVINNAQLTDAGNYTLVVSNGTCDASASMPVVVGPLPGLPLVNSPVSMCEGEQTALTAQGQNLLWYTQPTGGTGQTTLFPVTTTANTTTYYVSQTINGCEGPREALTVVVHPLPAQPAATNSYTYCEGEAATQLTATGNNLQWYDVATGGTPLAVAPTPSTTVPGTFTWYVTQSDVNCESIRKPITVTVNAKPAAPLPEPRNYCTDDVALPLTANGQGLIWYTVPVGGTGSTTPPTPNTTVAGSWDYYVSQTVNGCEGDRAMVTVNVYEKVTASLTASTSEACVGKPVTITFTGTGPTTATYTWSFDGGTTQSGTGAGPYTIVWNEDGNKMVTVTITNNICTATASLAIDVDPTPVAYFEMQDDGCKDGEIKVWADSSLGDLPGYTWTFDNAQVLEGSGPGPYTLQWNADSTKIVSLTLTGIHCPSEPYYDSINIHTPHAEISWNKNAEICSEDSVFFSAVPGLDYIYTWHPGTHFRQDNGSQSVWGIIPFTSQVSLVVMDRWGCTANDQVNVVTTPCCNVFLPNAFTPNADGKNDVFRMVTNGNQDIARFIIVNRWGQVVFETANQFEAWDGSYKGEPCEIGTYQYYLKYRCAEGKELTELQGDVTLLR
jgi:gliding motility-associated-like protein